MKKILVVFTGGTIGSSVAGDTINTTNGAPFKLLQMFQQHYPDAANIEFDVLQPLRILSENLAPAAWKLMINAVESVNLALYEGIIVTHGTDTLAYTAAALSFYFHALPLPLLLVSSDYPLENSKANGLQNFICAVEFIRQSISTGVFVPYQNAGQKMQIHRGSRLTCSLQLTGDFYSVQNKSLMTFAGKHFTLTDSQTNSFDSIHNAKNASPQIKLQPMFANRILMLKPYPGLDYSHVNLTNVAAVLHDLYHSGTACATEQWGNELSLITFLQRCRKQSINVFLAPAYRSGSAYQSTRQLIADGAEVIWNMSIEAAYVKLMLAYGNFEDYPQRLQFLQQPLAFEDVNL